ncbi:reverse transcriptase [Gossypium australe]|uniref:Reverse transcriptase n=1 Tax=Gossypium australe TaxID=47621 RepID=A0A5B6UKT5_9ROSI|nr:reverse transcriptase [Gossypium australe]
MASNPSHMSTKRWILDNGATNHMTLDIRCLSLWLIENLDLCNGVVKGDWWEIQRYARGVADPKKVLEGIEGSISHEINDILQSPFKEDEVYTALKGMGPLKAPGSDGFPALFFQKYWHIVGNEVLEFCLGVLNDGKGIESTNTTDIVLFPKISQPTILVNFRPISLCTVIYKIVTKAIMNRLQDVIGNCIDKAQSVFVLGRLISDNVLLAYELLHTFRRKKTGKKGYKAVKLDMSKAYDRVEWDFV